MMEFRDQKHEKLYDEICSRMKNLDDYHKSLAYLLALDVVCREHISDIFDFNEDGIRPACVVASWQTGTLAKTERKNDRSSLMRFTPFLYLSGGGSVVHYITGAEMPQEAISPCLSSKP